MNFSIPAGSMFALLSLACIGLSVPAQASDCLSTGQRIVQAPTVPELKARFTTLGSMLEPKVAGLVQQYERLLARDPVLAQIFGESLVLQVATTERQPNRALALSSLFEMFERVHKSVANISRKDAQELWVEFLDAKVPAAQVSARVRNFLESPSKESLSQALGELTLADSKTLFDELVARYLSETQASTVVRRFHRGAAQGVVDTSSALGDERLVVTVSAATFEQFKKYFSGSNQFFHLHTPRQGTLMVGFQGKVGSYANIQQDFRAPTIGTILPTIVLSSSEAERMHQFIRLGSANGGAQYALTPWTLQGYCATGGYSSCTHWFGNIPIGDRMVSEYRFPGKIDQHASNSISPDPVIDAAPRVQALGNFTYSGSDQTIAHLLPQVWGAPGSEQLADVIGLAQSNLSGELANPGWVAISLTGSAPRDRVPVVFYIVSDHRAPIAPDFDPQIAAY
jgi:hypothetical protein